jgi:hypothetical protein
MPFKPFPKGNKLAKGGSRPNSGRKPLALRALCADSFFDRISKLTSIIDAPDARPADRIAAMSLLAKIGLPSQFENVGAMPTAIAWQLPPLPREDPTP